MKDLHGHAGHGAAPDAKPVSLDAELEKVHGAQRHLVGTAAKIVLGIALVFSTYQLIVAAFHPFSSIVIRSLHVGFLVALSFLFYPIAARANRKRVTWYDWLLAATGFGIGLYHLIFEQEIVVHAGDPTTFELIIGTTLVVMVFEAARRIMGLALPIVCAVFLAYGLFGQYAPGDLAHRGYDYGQIVGQLFISTDGLFGIPTYVSATYIFLFVLFGAFMEHAGMIRLFNNLALGFVGHKRGGPAKVAVVASGFMGTISGSGVANVLTVGQFTIPLMKRFGYSGTFAGAVEATSSMGGQIMPPVMGAVAFIMAETLNVPYLEVVKAAIIPALLYYATAYWTVHLEAGRRNLTGLDKKDCPNPWKALWQNWYLILPLAALVFMLFHGAPPAYAGMTGLVLTAILILGSAVAARIGPTPFRVTLWLGIGLISAAFVKYFNIWFAAGLIATLVAVVFFLKGGRETLRNLRDALYDGARQALPVGIACAIVGVIIGVLSLTGSASSFTGFILNIGETSLFISLFLTMIACLILGMGIPTIPNYIITSAIAAPALLKLGVPLIVSHMFVFYFGIMADLTPPVALAAFAASSIAKESPMKIGFKATQIAIAGFIIPYIAVYDNALMVQGEASPMMLAVAGFIGLPGLAFTFSVVYVVVKCLLAIGLWGGMVVGYLFAPLQVWERAWAFASAAFLIAALPATDEIGFLSSAAFLVWHLLLRRRRLGARKPPVRSAAAVD